jgi:hypothetical protein
MNYLVFRLRKIMSEEDTFWLFCIIVESYLPPDYYVEMYGAKTHATILIRIFEQYNILPRVLEKFQEMDYPIVTFSCQFFLSLFTVCLPETESLKILDLFLLEGLNSNKLLFDVTLAYLRILEKDLIECSNFTTVIDNNHPAFKNPNLLMTEVKKARQ